jgi:hypothetical protein
MNNNSEQSAIRNPQSAIRFVPGWLRPFSVFGTLLRFVMRDFFRSPWTVFNVLAIILLQFFLPDANPTRTQFFSLVYLFMLALSALNTMAIFSRANGSHTYPILARPVTRTGYIVASISAAWLVSALAYLVVTALAFLRYGPPFQTAAPDWLGFPAYLMAGIPMVVGIAFAVSLMSLLVAFVAPFWVRFVVLAIIAILVMSFDPRNFPVPYLQGVVENIPPLLAPIAGALRFATETPATGLSIVSVIILAAYTSTCLALVLLLSIRREIVLE